MNAVYLSVACFAFAAVIGLYLISFILKGVNPAINFAFLHGALAVTGLVLLIVHCVKQTGDFTLPLVFFIGAAIGGLVMISMHLMGKKIPKWLALGHGSIAVIGFIALLMATF